jgi:hypothetical protein
MKMLRISRPTSSSDAMSYILCGLSYRRSHKLDPPQAVEWTYTPPVSRRRGDRNEPSSDASHCRYAHSIRIASLLRAKMIFGRDTSSRCIMLELDIPQARQRRFVGRSRSFPLRLPAKVPRCLYTVVSLAGARWISRMSPWCTVATWPLSQAIVTASQLVSVILPPSVASPRQ